MTQKSRYWGIPPADREQRRVRSSGIATAGMVAFPFKATPGEIDFFVNHAKLSPTDFTSDGNYVTLKTPLTGGEPYEIIGDLTVPVTDAAPNTSSFGYGQKSQNVTASRLNNTTYYNVTGKSIFVSITGAGLGATASTFTVNGSIVGQASQGNGAVTFTGFVLPGESYSVNFAGGLSANGWFEVR